MTVSLAYSELNDAYNPVNLFAGSIDVSTLNGTLLTGQNLSQYHVIAKQTATGKFVEFDAAGSGGANVAVGILLFASNATAADQPITYYSAGCFNQDALVWKAGTTDAQKAAAFERTNISVRKIGYSG